MHCEPPLGQVESHVQRASRVRARQDDHEHPPLKLGVPEGGTREEADGAVGGEQRSVRGDAGVDKGLGARPDGQEYERFHGSTEC